VAVAAALAVTLGTSAQAALPVIDIRAIFQMVQQIRTMQDQLVTARSQLQEAQSQLQSMTGGRGLENLLGAEPRNYLPTNWQELSDVMAARSVRYGALANSLESLIRSNAILSDQARAALPPSQQQALDRIRREVALDQSIAREALSTTSERFNSLGELIAALSRTRDPKAVWDLQARISAEQAMLSNENAKLAMVFETARADRAARDQQLKEAALRDIGRLRKLPPMGL
jgi:type IV secretion system protein VirB5